MALPMLNAQATGLSPRPGSPPPCLVEPLDAEWRKFRDRLREVPAFQALTADGPAWDTTRLERACRLCWDLGTLETEGLAQKMEELNLRSLKQLDLLRDKKRRYEIDGMTEEHLVEYYEPLKYLSGVTRQLVVAILVDKMEQLLKGGANRWLLRELMEAGAVGSAELKATAEAAEERARKLEITTSLLDKQLAQVKDRVEELTGDLKAKERDIKAAQLREQRAQEQAAELTEELSSARTQVTGLEAEKASLLHELSSFRDVRARLEQEVADLNGQLDRAVEAVANAVEELNLARAQRREMQETVAATEARMKEVEAKCRELQSQFDKLEKRAVAAERRASSLQLEVDLLQKRLASLTPEKRSQGAQTDLVGSELDEQREENTRVKAMLEEFRLKLALFGKEASKHLPGKDVQRLLDGTGLSALIKVPSCFERLYDDAIDRIARLEALQDKYAEQQRAILPTKFALREELVGALEGSTLEREVRMLEQRGLLERKLVQPPTASLFLDVLPPLHAATMRGQALPWGSGFTGWTHRPLELKRRSPEPLMEGCLQDFMCIKEPPRRAPLIDPFLPQLTARRVLGLT